MPCHLIMHALLLILVISLADHNYNTTGHIFILIIHAHI